jgi:hypothetical protein
MNQAVVGVLNKIKETKGEEVFSNQRLFTALFNDFAKGEFKGELHLLSLAFREGIFQKLKENPSDWEEIRRHFRVRMSNEYCWTAEQTDFVVFCFLCVLGKASIPENVLELKRLQNEAENGDAAACYKLGLVYETAEDVTRDYEKAAFWFQRAASKGHLDAQNRLALCYYSGRGVQQDYSLAEYWWTQAAQRGHVMAQFNLGIRYSYGLGAKKDVRKAAHWFLQAARQGYADAQNCLGVIYRDGNGVKQNNSKAAYWFAKSAEQGCAGRGVQPWTMLPFGPWREAGRCQSDFLAEKSSFAGRFARAVSARSVLGGRRRRAKRYGAGAALVF